MFGEAAEKIYDAASKGDVSRFQELLQDYPYLVNEASFACSRNLLHIATMCGQAGIVEEVLKTRPRLARSFDSEKSSALHIAAAEGNVEIAKKLLSVAPEMCWSRDCQGMNPIHIAAMNGHVEILQELVDLDPLPAMERVHRGQTVLHLCVRHHQLEALEVLMEKVGELAPAKNEDGDTVLHWAARSNQLEMVWCLVRSQKIMKLEKNSMGETALDSLRHNRGVGEATNNYSEIESILRRLQFDVSDGDPEVISMMVVVVVLIATMAFQAVVSPPGGVWQDDSPTHRAGQSVMASNHPKVFKHFVRAISTAFVSSFTAIFMLSTGAVYESLRLQVFGMYAMWVSMLSIAVSYGTSLLVITPQSHDGVIGIVVASPFVISIWLFFMDSVLSGRHKNSRKREENHRADLRPASSPQLDLPSRDHV